MKPLFKALLIVIFVSVAIFALLSISVSEAAEEKEVTATYENGKWIITPEVGDVKVSGNVLEITGSEITDVNMRIVGCNNEDLIVYDEAKNSTILNLSIDGGSGSLTISSSKNTKVNIATVKTQMELYFEGAGNALSITIKENISIGGLSISNYTNVEITSNDVERCILSYKSSSSIEIIGNSYVFIHAIDIINGEGQKGNNEIDVSNTYEVYIYDANLTADRINIYASMKLNVGVDNKGESYDGDTILSANQIKVTVGVSAFMGSDANRGKCTIYGDSVEISCVVTNSVTFQNMEIKANKTGSTSNLLICSDAIRIPIMDIIFKGDYFVADNIIIRSVGSIIVDKECAFHSIGDVEFNKITLLEISNALVVDGNLSIKDVSDSSTINLDSSKDVVALTARSILIDRCTNLEIEVNCKSAVTGIMAINGDVRISKSHLEIKIDEESKEPTLISASGAIYLEDIPEGNLKFFKHSGDVFEPMNEFTSGTTAKIEGYNMSIVTVPTSTLDIMVIILLVTIAVAIVGFSVLTEYLIRKK